MTRHRLLLALGIGIALLVPRRGLLVRGIRWLDRRGGLASRRGEAAYRDATRLFGGLYRRVASDAAAAGATVIADIGPGPGDVLLALRGLAPESVLIGVEPSERMRAIAAARGLAEIDGRAERLPLPDASVDLVLSTLSSHHWDDPTLAFAEIDRVLRPGGAACIYDVRLAGFGPDEARRMAVAAGLAPDAVRHEVVDERVLVVRPYSRITLRR